MRSLLALVEKRNSFPKMRHSSDEPQLGRQMSENMGKHRHCTTETNDPKLAYGRHPCVMLELPWRAKKEVFIFKWRSLLGKREARRR